MPHQQGHRNQQNRHRAERPARFYECHNRQHPGHANENLEYIHGCLVPFSGRRFKPLSRGGNLRAFRKPLLVSRWRQLGRNRRVPHMLEQHLVRAEPAAEGFQGHFRNTIQ